MATIEGHSAPQGSLERNQAYNGGRIARVFKRLGYLAGRGQQYEDRVTKRPEPLSDPEAPACIDTLLVLEKSAAELWARIKEKNTKNVKNPGMFNGFTAGFNVDQKSGDWVASITQRTGPGMAAGVEIVRNIDTGSPWVIRTRTYAPTSYRDSIDCGSKVETTQYTIAELMPATHDVELVRRLGTDFTMVNATVMATEHTRILDPLREGAASEMNGVLKGFLLSQN